MTNTKFRKRMLLSSVAMLLVALVALGSATFAWFTSSTTATASGINVQTVQASDLQISKSDFTWGTSVNYATTATFEPASSINGVNWFSGEGTSRTDGTQKSGQDWVALTSANKGGYVFEDMLNVRNNGKAAVNNVTITFNFNETPATNGKNYLRIAVVPLTATTDSAAGSETPTAANFQANVYAADTTAYNGVSAVDTASTQITPKATYSINVGNLAGKTDSVTAAKYYKLFVWFEGQDADCQDQYAGNSLPSISFQVTGTTAQS